MRILKKLLIAVAPVVLVVKLAVVTTGFFIPSERSFTNEMDIDAPVEKVALLRTDTKRFTEWRSQLDRAIDG